jgi:hypothetical protein
MRSVVGLILAACLIWATPAGAAGSSSGPIDGRRLNDLMSGYYLTPDPKAALAWLPRVEPQVLQRPEAIDLMAMFYIHLLRANPGLAGSLVDAAGGGAGPAVLVAATAVWMSGLPDRADLLGRLRATGRLSETELNRLARFPVFDPVAFAPQSAHELDLSWAAFYATGDATYIEKVARHLPYMVPKDTMMELGKSDDPVARAVFERALVARAAAWSLVSHARRHERVMTALRSLAVGEDKMNKAVQALFDEVVQPARAGGKK